MWIFWSSASGIESDVSIVISIHCLRESLKSKFNNFILFIIMISFHLIAYMNTNEDESESDLKANAPLRIPFDWRSLYSNNSITTQTDEENEKKKGRKFTFPFFPRYRRKSELFYLQLFFGGRFGRRR